MEVKFTKMQGTGNDFVVVDEWNGEVVPTGEKEGFVRRVCARHFGVGADGLIFVQKSKTADVNFVFYNPDGSRAEMCGNGIRCLAKYVYEHKLIGERHIEAETLAGTKTLDLEVLEDVVVEVRVNMGAPQVKRGEAQVAGDPKGTLIDEKIMIHGFEYNITSVGMGNPHAIIFYGDLEEVDLKTIGPRIRHYGNLFPNGVNVHFVEEQGENEFRIRTYERGVEDETLGCGTGICASAVAAVLNKKADPDKPIRFHARGGDVKVELETNGRDIKEVYLIGPAEEVYTGKIRA
ncbi:MAG: diaminopimelate epimerase [Candidatus Altiarchaeales archaeon]|nr:diaminopimelate epimerase [Candidatus Altiarchaeales archaeon]MBD3417312.1 diaminopimelate epimerase [Candidatus Altiarchaeales archaeon]